MSDPHFSGSPEDHPTENQPIENPRNLPVERKSAALTRSGGHVPRTALEPSEPGSPDFGPAFLLWVLRQWWKITVPVGLVLAVIAGIAIMYTYVPEYQATALIAIEDSEPFIAFNNKGKGSAKAYIQTQIELLRGPMVIGPVLSRPEIAAIKEFQGQLEPQKQLSKKLSIKRVNGSELYKVGYVSKVPKDAATIANAVVAEYLASQSDEDYQRSRRVISLLEEEHKRRLLEVERLREHVLTLSKEVTGKDPFGQGVSGDSLKFMQPIGSLYQSLMDIDVQQAVIRAQIQALHDSTTLISDPADASGLLDLNVSNDPRVQQQQAVLEQIRGAIQSIEETYRNPETTKEYIQFTKDLEEHTKQLADIKLMVRKQLSGQRRDLRGEERKRAIVSLEQDLATLEVKKNLLTSRFDEHVENLKDGGAKSIELEFARGELAREESVFEMIAARKLALQTELRAPTRVRLLQKASPSGTPIAPIPFKLLFMGCSLAFASPLGLAVAREALVRRIGDVGQLRKESQLHVLGEVSRFPIRPVATHTHLLSKRMRQEMCIFAESIDSLRTNLVLSGQLGSKDVLVVTSATSGEGKTSVSTSLAGSIAAATKKPTVIVDADMRSPDVADVLGTPSEPGLAEVLLGKCTLREAVHRVGESNTYVVPAGNAKMNPHHLIQPQLVEQLLERLKQEFETIVIDTPPILGASESLVFAKVADTVLYCSLRDVSRARHVRQAVHRLEHSGAPVAGAVLGGMPVNHYAYSYGYYVSQASSAN